MNGKNLFMWIVIVTVLFKTYWCSSDCEIKEIRNSNIYYHWDWRQRNRELVKRTYAQNIEFWIRPQRNLEYVLIKIEDTNENLQVPNTQLKKNEWSHISFKAWYSEQSSEEPCIAAAIVNDEYVVKQVLKCPKNVESLNFIQQKEIYVNGEADFSFDCNPNKIVTTSTSASAMMLSTSPQSITISNSIPTYGQMVTVLVILSFVTLIFIFILVQLMDLNYHFEWSKKRCKPKPEGLLMSDRTLAAVENNYEEIRSPEPEEPTAPKVEEAQMSLKSKKILEE